jgi:hypothetical protein
MEYHDREAGKIFKPWSLLAGIQNLLRSKLPSECRVKPEFHGSDEYGEDLSQL